MPTWSATSMRRHERCRRSDPGHGTAVTEMTEQVTAHRCRLCSECESGGHNGAESNCKERSRKPHWDRFVPPGHMAADERSERRAGPDGQGPSDGTTGRTKRGRFKGEVAAKSMPGGAQGCTDRQLPRPGESPYQEDRPKIGERDRRSGGRSLR